MHDLPLIGTIAAAFFVAWLLGLLTQRLGLSPIVGYLLAGVVIGPSTPGFTGDLRVAQQLAEVGVILLMFGVGLHFDVKDLLAVRRVAITGAIGQSLVATLLGVALFAAFGFPLKTGFVVGMALAVASTVVLIRMLEDRKLLASSEGHVAVGWLVVEDVFTVIILVIIPIIGSTDGVAEAATPWDLTVRIGWVFFKLGVLIAAVVFIGSRAIPWVLVRVARSRSRELFTLTVLVFSIALAAGAYVVFGASMALGAFLAGMMVAQSPSSHQVAADALPLRDAFAVLFFVSVGMLFDPAAVFSAPLLLLGGLAIVLVAKPLAALALVLLLGHSTKAALTVAVGLAQIGEFSFILSDAARKHGLMPEAGHNLLIATAIISISVNPLLFAALPRLESFIRQRPRLWKLLNRGARGTASVGNLTTIRRMTEAARAKKRLAIVVGYGPVGQAVDRILRDADIETVIVDTNIETVIALQKQDRNAVFGDATRSHILEHAGVRRATHVILTFPEAIERTAVISVARNLNPAARILVRARYLSEKNDLDQAGASAAVFEEAESAVALARLVLTDTGASREVVDLSIRDLRLRLILENLSDLSGRTVRSVMVPWSRVRRLSTAASLEAVLGMVAKEHYSRWPVEDPATTKPVGYLLVKDLVGGLNEGVGWTTLVRPIRSVAPDAPIEPTLRQLQAEGATVCLVEEAGRPIGLFTIEDILEQVVGRMEDEYPRHASISLADAVSRGAVLLDLVAPSAEAAIVEMASAIPPGRVPANANIAELAIAREREIHTDVGLGVAMPHARCPDLPSPLVVFARSAEGITFDPGSPEPVRLLFLLVTAAEKPEDQVFLLGQLARLAGDASVRQRLSSAATAEHVHAIVAPGP